MFVHEMGTKSHLLQLFPIVESLLARGHEVTGVFYSPSKISNKNYTEVLIPNVMADFQKEIRCGESWVLMKMDIVVFGPFQQNLHGGGRTEPLELEVVEFCF